MLSVAAWLGNVLAYGTTGRAARRFGAGDRAAAVAEGVQASWIAVAAGVAGRCRHQFGAGAADARSRRRRPGGGRRPRRTWLRIAALGAPGLMLATAGNGWMRGVQDTRRPLCYVLGANVLSALLCPLLVYPVGLGWPAPRSPTSTAQTLAGVLFIRALVPSGCRCAPQPRVHRAASSWSAATCCSAAPRSRPASSPRPRSPPGSARRARRPPDRAAVVDVLRAGPRRRGDRRPVAGRRGPRRAATPPRPGALARRIGRSAACAGSASRCSSRAGAASCRRCSRADPGCAPRRWWPGPGSSPCSPCGRGLRARRRADRRRRRPLHAQPDPGRGAGRSSCRRSGSRLLDLGLGGVWAGLTLFIVVRLVGVLLRLLGALGGRRGRRRDGRRRLAGTVRGAAGRPGLPARAADAPARGRLSAWADGLVVVDKPGGMTSHDVVPGAPAGPDPPGRARRHAGPDGDRRAGDRGRAGDPAAHVRGRHRQVYRGTIRLGQSTVTDDAEGEITADATPAT